ncbi:Tetratricopeptide repeat-containing protein [Hymenobacter daecheongensis DSM 21074]|uniref:Tetratricopeptide repeat-containing protein n=1 Tax=Hymenobacter daecheongensis DSM 21074 TaxID=1121955 RepID=A0A1M6A410_9BACT|nr:Tetratricopeptide repeat-containing protein [Hymenobacter daecheongensis DSM 21074]
MNFKPWKLSLLVALSVSGSAAIAQNTTSAQKSIELERYNEARASLLKLGQSADASFALGRLYQLRNMPDSAAYYFNRVPLNPKDAMSLVAAGRAALAQGKTAEAEIHFDNAAKLTKSKDAKVLTMIAQAYAESDVKDATKALSYVEAAHKANKGKDDAALMIARGDIYLKQETGGGEAMSSYERASLANPNDALSYYRKGQLNVRSRNYNEARTSFEKALSLDPSYAPAQRDLAEMYFYAGKYDDALSGFQKYMAAAEKTPDTDAKYASFLFLTKKYPEALVEIDKVLARDPNNLTMNRLRAYSLYETGKNDEAIAAMDKFMKTAPAGKVLKEDNVYYAKMLSKSGKGEQGVALLEKAVAADPTNGDLRKDLAQAYLSKKDYPNAIGQYKMRMKDGKGDLADNVLLARAYELNKQYTQADSLYNVVLVARPTYVPGYMMRAHVNTYLDPTSKLGTAKPYYEKYIEVATANDPAKYKDGLIEANNYLGSYYLFTKSDKAAALPYYQKVLALDPGNKDATVAVNEITGKNKVATKAPAKKAPVKKK